VTTQEDPFTGDAYDDASTVQRIMREQMMNTPGIGRR
jgi:hypothetical protein